MRDFYYIYSRYSWTYIVFVKLYIFCNIIRGNWFLRFFFMSFKKNIKKNKCLKLAALLLSCHRLYAKVKRLSKKLDESTKDVESQVYRRLFISNTTNIYIQ